MTTPGAADGARPASSGGRAPSPAAETTNPADRTAQEPPLLELRGIGKNFGPVRALSDINLTIPVGQVTALVGDNGAGKSTLIKTISGIWQPDHGEILWQGRPVHLHSPRAAADLGIATVYQDLALCDNLDIVQNMFLGREAMKYLQLDEIGMELAAKQTLADLSVVTVRSIRQPVGSLSGGQRQAVAVAKAVMQQAQLVIMDEPTAALGVTQTRVVLELIDQLSSRGIAVLVISHNLNDVIQVADRVAVLYLGRLAAVAPIDELDTASIVELMTTGRSGRLGAAPGEPAHAASQPGARPAFPGWRHGRQRDRGESHRRGTVSTETHQPPESAEQGDELATEAERAAAPEVIAGSLGEYMRLLFRRIRSGESGALPVTLGLIAIVIYFQVRNSLFLSPGNLVNLLIQGSPYIILGMAEVWVLLLGEIDLSVGYSGAVCAVITAWAVFTLPWWVAILLGLATGAVIGSIFGLLITRLALPSFVVTLAGLLGLQGLLILLVARSGHGPGGSIPISNSIIDGLTTGNLSPVAGWIVMVVIVAAAAAILLLRDRQRRAAGLVTPPLSVTVLKIVVMAVAGVVVVLVGNADRGVGLVSLRGVPWVVLIVLGVLVIYTVVLGRTRFGRYIYAIGGNAEAARRAGVNLNLIRTLAFTLTGLTAAIAGIVLASRLGSISTNTDGGQLVLFAVAAAVIGGTHLFGGHGKMINALLGGLVVAAIYNGLGLLGLSAAATYIVTALVLLAAVTIDALSQRGRSA